MNDAIFQEKKYSEVKREYEHNKSGRYMQMGVADTGTGMAAQLMKRIFDPFITTKVNGTVWINQLVRRDERIGAEA